MRRVSHIYTANVPQDFFTSRRQVAVNKPKRCAVEEEGDADSSLVSWNNRDAQPQTFRLINTNLPLIRGGGRLPNVFPKPVFTLAVCTWLTRPSCSGFTNTASLIFHRDCTATYRTRLHVTTSTQQQIPCGQRRLHLIALDLIKIFVKKKKTHTRN